jgi:hypothetical protein
VSPRQVALQHRFDELPIPKRGRVTIYLFGPGFGESAVLAMPDLRWVAVDCCIGNGGLNFTSGLLQHFGVQEIDLLVVTHPDLDHIAGIDELISRFSVRRVWRYPGAGTLQDLLPKLVRRYPADRRLRTVERALRALDRLHDNNIAFDAAIQTRAWSPSHGEYYVRCVAPVPHDVFMYRKRLDYILEDFVHGGSGQSMPLRQFLTGTRRSIGGGANPLSLGISIKWSSIGILLAGDVEAGPNQQSGWPAVLKILEEDGETELLRRMTVVKAPHHGSNGALHVPAWDLHSEGRRVSVVAVTPFNRGRNSPPHGDALGIFSAHCNQLAITSEPRLGWSAVPSQQWSQVRRSITAIGDLPVVAIEIKRAGTLRVVRGTPGRVFSRT